MRSRISLFYDFNQRCMDFKGTVRLVLKWIPKYGIGYFSTAVSSDNGMASDICPAAYAAIS